MKLTVRFVDLFDANMAVVHMNCTAPPAYRTVVIQLTEEQASLLQKRVTGKHNGEPVYELREVIALENEEAGK